MEIIEGGICASVGFQAGACHCGIRKNLSKDDLALIYSDQPCECAAVYTQNIVKAAPLRLTKEHLFNGRAQAIIINSGNANACNEEEMENALKEAQSAARYLHLNTEDVLVASTGVIGQRLPIECIENNINQIELSKTNSLRAAYAILTLDKLAKSIAIEFEINGKKCHMGGICKGSGMIHPNMGTMLAFITTDCKITHDLLDELLKRLVKKTFNRISVDGDTSTNDMCVVMANGMADNPEINKEDGSLQIFEDCLHYVMEDLAKKIAADGEGAGKLMTCTVKGAQSEKQAETLAMSVCSSSLVKTAAFGADANWGRVMCALGYAGVPFDPYHVDIYFSNKVKTVQCCKDGMALDFDETLAKEILSSEEIEIISDMKQGSWQVSCWGCDLTYDYVRINGDYRS